MGRSRGVFYLIIILLLPATSCNLPTSPSGQAPTLTTLPSPLPTLTEAPTEEPVISPASTSTITPSETPIPSNLYLPNGVATLPTGSGRVDYYDLNGQLLGELQSPNIGTDLAQHAVIAGPLRYSPGPVLPPLVYYSYENSGELWVNNNNNASLLVAAPNMLNITGVPGKSTISYTLLEYLDFGLRSRLFLGNSMESSTIQVILDNTNTETYAIKPLAIATAEDKPTGVWYTTVPYGIGGDIVFDPRKALNFIDLSTSQVNTLLDQANGPAGISTDQAWVAYTPSGGAGPLTIVHNLDFSSAFTFPLKADSDRGAGDAVFSPDNQYVAWKEASGSIMGTPSTLRETIRIATTSGNILTEIPDTSLLAASGFQVISWVVPVGWFDTQTLALEIKGEDWNTACILRVKLDGSGLAYVAPGSFVGFLYP